VVVLNFGRKIFEGTPEAVKQDAAVLEAYLGTPDAMEARHA
jgi:branched-chain amino acid transport system ATP-binding protein